MTPLPDDIPTVNAVEFAAEMTKSWERQTSRIVHVIAVSAILGAVLVMGVNVSVQYRLSHATQILDTTQMTVAQNQSMIDGLREDRQVSEMRFKTVMSALKNLEQTAVTRYGNRKGDR